jgi:hypothetical protein
MLARCDEILDGCLATADWTNISNDSSHHPSVIQAEYSNMKLRCNFLVANNYENILDILDIVKVSDVLLFVINVDCPFDNIVFDQV